MFSIMVSGMAPANRDKILFSVRDSERFPGELWRQFRAACEARREPWIDVLRRLIAGYVAQEPKP